MHTGYDSFWMYQNNRHEPVLNLPKNDNYGPAVLTDCYKQAQNGGRPSHLNSFMPPQNNVATSYQNGQHRASGSQYMWPSSVYSQSLKPSYVSNFHSQEACSTQSNNLGCPPRYAQTQPRDMRYFKNPTTTVSQAGSNTSNKQNNSGTSPVTSNSYSTMTAQTPRIRVKDLYTLNNNAVSNEVPNSRLYQILLKEQHEFVQNYPAINHSITCNSGTQNEFVNYRKSNLLQSNPPSYYQATAREQPPQVSTNSSLFFQQNTQPQLLFGNGRPVQRNFTTEGSVEKSVLGNVLNRGNNQVSNILNESAEPLLGHKKLKARQKGNLAQSNNSEVINNSGYVNSRLTHTSSNQNSVAQAQNQQMGIDDAALYRSSLSGVAAPQSDGSASTDVRTSSFASSNGLKNTVIKISIPHSGQSTYLTFSDCNSTNNDSSLSLANLLEANNGTFGGWKQDTPNTKENSNVTQPVEAGLSNPHVPSNVSNTSNPVQSNHNPESVHRANSTVPPRKRFCRVLEPFIDVNKENVEAFLNADPDFDANLGNFGSKVNSESDAKDRNLARETIFQNDITLNALTLKQEHFSTRVESPVTDRQIPEGKVMFEMIKKEGNRDDENPDESEMEEYETHSSEERHDLEEPLASVLEVTENIEFIKPDIERFVFPSEPSLKESENCAEPAKNPKNEESSSEELNQTEINYKSRINRDKLDMLIQFLEKDEGPGEMRAEDKKKNNDSNKRKKEVDLNHNRRKLSKTCIVKNKNNSREMISMVSHKPSRGEFAKSPEKPSSGSEKLQEIKASSAEEPDDRVNGSDKQMTCHPARENLTRPKSETKNESEFVSKHHVETCRELSSESAKQRNVINTIRGLQVLETIFCASCGLVSTLDSFWINLVSGEFRCLNCLGKMKGDPGETQSKVNETKTMRKDRTENNRENGNVLKDRSKCSSKLETNTKNTKPESVESLKSPKHEHSTNHASGQGKRDTMASPKKSRRHSSSSEEKGRSGEEHPVKTNTSKEESTHKVKYSEDGSKAEMKDEKIKRRDSVSKESCAAPKTSSTPKQLPNGLDKSERKNAEEATKKEKKGTECSSQKKRRDSKDFGTQKSTEDNARKETKVDSSVKKRESYHCHKDNSAEQPMKKSTKLEQSEKTKTRSPLNESCTCYKAKTSEQTKPNSTEEGKTKSSTNSEKQKRVDSVGQPRKRKNSVEDLFAVKIRVVEEHTKKEPKPVATASKQDTAKHKSVNDTQSAKNLTEKRRSSLSKEEEHSKKETKQAIDSSSSFLKEKSKTCEPIKQKGGDSADVPRRKSKDEPRTKQETGDVQRRKSISKEDNGVRTHVQEISKRDSKHGSLTTDSKDKKKKEEKEKFHSSGKTAKTSSSDNREKVISSSEQPRKSDTTWKPLKENQNTKMRSSTTTENGKVKKDSLEDKKEPKNYAEDRREKKNREKETADISFRKNADSEKKKCSDLSDGICDKSQTENKNSKSSDKAVVDGQKGSQEGIGNKHSAVLLAKLIKKTKKLSWSLLGEA